MQEGEIHAIDHAAALYPGPGDRALVQNWKINVPRFPAIRYNALDLCGPPKARGRIASHRQLRSALFATTRKLLAAGGYGAVTVQALADRHGISRPTVYSTVGSRPELLRGAIDEFLTANTTIALHCARTVGLNPIVALADTLWFTIAADTEYARQMMVALHDMKSHPRLRSVVYKPLQDTICRALATLRDDALMAPVAIDRVAHAMTRQIVAVLTEWAEDPAPLDELYANLMWGMLLLVMGAAGEQEAQRLRLWLDRCRVALDGRRFAQGSV